MLQRQESEDGGAGEEEQGPDSKVKKGAGPNGGAKEEIQSTTGGCQLRALQKDQQNGISAGKSDEGEEVIY